MDLIKFLENHIVIVSILLFGAATNVLVTIQAARKSVPPVILDWLDHIVSFVTAILTGLVCGWMAESFFTDNKQLIWTSVAMGGFVGHKGLTIVMDLFLEKLTDKIAKAELSDKDTKK